VVEEDDKHWCVCVGGGGVSGYVHLGVLQ